MAVGLLNLLKGKPILFGNVENTLYDKDVGSKGLRYPTDREAAAPLLGDLVTWDSENVSINSMEAPPNFEYGSSNQYRRGSRIDNFVRGGVAYNLNRRR